MFTWRKGMSEIFEGRSPCQKNFDSGDRIFFKMKADQFLSPSITTRIGFSIASAD